MNLADVESKLIIDKDIPEWVVDYPWLSDESSSSTSSMLHLEQQCHAVNNTRYFRQIHRLNTTEAVQNGSVLELDINPTFEILALHTFRVHRNSTVINKLPTVKKRVIQKESQSHQFIFTQIWTLILILDDIRLGDIIEYSYSYARIHSTVSDYFQQSFYFSSYRSIEQQVVRLIAPPQIQLKYHGNIQSEPIVRAFNAELHEWCWHVAKVPVIEWEEGRPSWYNPHQWVQVSTFQSWEEAAVAAQRFFSTSSHLCEAIRDQLIEWRKQSIDALNLIDIVIRFVQKEIRYTSIEERYLGHSTAVDPNEVFTRRFGDCKDKTWLLHVLLKELGIESYPALVNTNLIKLPEYLPSLIFDHAILAIFYDGTVYWIDPTHAYQGGTFGHMVFAPVEHGLLVGKPGLNLVQVKDLSPPAKTETTLIYDLSAGPHIPAEMRIETRFYNESADNLRKFVANQPPEELSKSYLNYFRQFYPQMQTISLIRIEDNLKENVIAVWEAYTIPDAGINDQGHYRFEVFGINLLFGLINYDIDVHRNSPMALNYPSNIKETIVLKMPCPSLFDLDNFEVSNQYYQYSEIWTVSENTLSCTYSLKTLQDHIAVKDLDEVRRFIKEIKNRSVSIPWNLPKIKKPRNLVTRQLVKLGGFIMHQATKNKRGDFIAWIVWMFIIRSIIYFFKK